MAPVSARATMRSEATRSADDRQSDEVARRSQDQRGLGGISGYSFNECGLVATRSMKALMDGRRRALLREP